MGTGDFKFQRGDRVETTNNGTLATVKKNKTGTISKRSKKLERICVVHFDCDRPGKTWEMRESSLVAEVQTNN